MGFIRTRYRIRSGEIPDILLGSFTGSADTSGYVSVSNTVGVAPNWGSGRLVTNAAGAVNRQVAVKGLETDYVTFLITSAGTPLMTGSDLTLVWQAQR